ncbi:uncharacterized protein M421DRAFT_90108 [Didymella exigua CBS 183.55]|uniref:Uncharacterized protein n=1 Tax=Didymella exigua CBS 183.55 TaxID=1150837 RepID=A0A6A5RTU0_9PLEO|nr:uncharacterized protein M421DRAFT_90108 [Didymella exigua CBS 183.55]KAF1931905.1 hypothetical protein M421DRAFT_90108 [Didymella exigua CBS 183.55]
MSSRPSPSFHRHQMDSLSKNNWNYSGGLNWTILLPECLTSTGLEEYVEANIAKPFGNETFVWHLPLKPQDAEKLIRMSTRSNEGRLTDGPNASSPESANETGGLGMYADTHDYFRVLTDLLNDQPVLLSKPTVDSIFAPQFAPGSSALRDMRASGKFAYQCSVDDSMEGVIAD